MRPHPSSNACLGRTRFGDPGLKFESSMAAARGQRQGGSHGLARSCGGSARRRCGRRWLHIRGDHGVTRDRCDRRAWINSHGSRHRHERRSSRCGDYGSRVVAPETPLATSGTATRAVSAPHDVRACARPTALYPSRVAITPTRRTPNRRSVQESNLRRCNPGLRLATGPLTARATLHSGGRRNRTPRRYPSPVFKTGCRPFSGALQRARRVPSAMSLRDWTIEQAQAPCGQSMEAPSTTSADFLPSLRRKLAIQKLVSHRSPCDTLHSKLNA